MIKQNFYAYIYVKFKIFDSKLKIYNFEVKFISKNCNFDKNGFPKKKNQKVQKMLQIEKSSFKSKL